MENTLKIFKTNRISFEELYNDAFNYIKEVYNTNGQEFTIASPFAQIVTVILNLGRMILFYIENVITEMNIETAFHERNIRGLATLTGHTPSLGIAARGTLYMSYNNSSQYNGETISINNFTRIKNTANGLLYVAVFPNSIMQLTVGAYDTKIELPIIQGELKYQQATGTGSTLQSFNFANKGDSVIDNFFVNIYVNGKHWKSVDSLLDMTYNQEACIVKTSLNGGIDVFFGTGNNGKVPAVGSTILCEYLLTSGSDGNIDAETANNYWSFEDSGYDANGDYVDLNEIYNLSSGTDIIFGTDREYISVTKLLAPHMSRSFVLANPINYKTFLQKLNMFSIIDAFSGFNTYEDNKIAIQYSNAKASYDSLRETYLSQVQLTGKDSPAAQNIYEQLLLAQKTMASLKTKYDDAKLDDNIVYLYLIPDMTKRLSTGENYFTCSKDRFKLTTDEKNGIINLIESTGQKVLTVDNQIIDPIYVNFAMNIFVQIYSQYNFNTIKSTIISEISNYLITNTRRDRIPISDIIKTVEAIDGVDSVTAFFDADSDNSKYYGDNNYGIDEYGDIILTRTLKDKLGNTITVNDLQARFRGPFTSNNGIDYEDGIDSLICPINITLRGKTTKTI